MSVSVGVSLERVRIPVSRARVAAIVRAVVASERVAHAMLSVTFVGNQRIRALNRRHLRRDRITDVIAFSFRRASRKDPIVGDVYVAPAVGRESASANGISEREELVRLIVHGTLHALGHDHPDGAGRMRSAMWRKQERLVSRLRVK